MRFALIGAGAIGAVHARLLEALGDEAVLACVVDQNLERAGELVSQYGGRAFATPAEAYAAEEVDAVGICLPSALHADVAIEALRAGKHVIVEKPVDITLAAADRLIAAQRETGLTVSVISQRRFQPPVAQIRAAIDTGALGRVTSGIAESAFFRPQSYYDGDDWRGTLAIDGGGALMNQGIHALDLLVWMLGRPVQVSAQTGRLAHEGIEVEDLAGASIVFESGAIGLMLASTAAYPGRPVRLTIHGDQGTAVLDDDQLAYFAAADASAPEVPALAGPDGWGPVELAHLAQYRDFIAAVHEGRPPAVTLEAGRRSLATVLAVYESARSGQPVELKED
ncbi:Gfo/Idh/MocA family protein [Kribbella speibonae]|uniref:Gfo/Idh/MocA family oxidoreductase n=1 Tax=Kribbella speibonae TaxID=1572660 RepID=A0ABY2ABL0_9ACTN|nr:Gfo/Idh/MocA family oxidoreductase [Kribbella speibonae]TCC27045.1 Gfo/Idh/MocA family oxidoreductase [Kribbella speibonae]